MGERKPEPAFAERYGPWAVIAGGSDGIGAAFARDLARRGLDLALVARRRQPLEMLATALAEEFGVKTRAITADLSASDVAETLGRETADLDVGLLVYNAGSNRAAREFLDLSTDELLFQLHLSCRGPLLLAHHYAARLRARGRGGLVLMSSMACLAGSHYQSVYAAAKAFDTILAEGLWHELSPAGVDVLAVLAGATRTETVLASSGKFEDAMDPSEVAVGALDHLGCGPSFVPGDINRAATRGLWPAPRVPVINAMSRACGELFDLPHTPVDGIEFHESAPRVSPRTRAS